MANQKISQLASGVPAQSGDLLPIARSGANFSLTAQSIADLATDPLGLIATDFSGADLGAQINAAYAALPSTGGRIWIPAGTYNAITTKIDLSGGKSVTLVGEGMGNTILNFTLTGSEMILAGNSSTSGNLTLQGFTVAGTGAAHAGNYGIYVNGANKLVLIAGVEVTNAGSDAIVVSGSTAQVCIRDCYVHLNLNGYAVTCNNSGVENLTIIANDFFHNDGGVNVTANAGGLNIIANDIESDGSTHAMLNVASLGVYSSGNTYGCGSTSTNTDVATINTKAFNSTNDLFALGTSSQTALHITSVAERVYIETPALSAPGSTGGTGLKIDSGATFTYVINPSFYNGFSTNISDTNASTTILTEVSGGKMFINGPLALPATTGTISAATQTLDNSSIGGISLVAKAANANSDIAFRVYNAAAAPTNDVIQSKTVATSGTGFNFFTGYTGASADGSGGSPIFSIRGDGAIVSAGPHGFGNGSSANVTTTQLGTGSGPTDATAVVQYLEVILNGSTRWIPLFA